MDGYGSDFSAGGPGGKIDPSTIMEQVKVQIAVANAQELLQVTLNQWTQLLKLARLTPNLIRRRVTLNIYLGVV